MRYLVTGGAGFIGSHLSERLLENGHAVVVLDDLSTGSEKNVASLLGNPGFELVVGSAADPSLVKQLVDEVDAIYHLAAAVGVERVIESPVRAIETNVRCTEVVLKAVNGSRKPVMITSTSEVYGKSDALPFREDGDLTLGPTNVGRWAYACSKAIDEFLAIAYWKEQRLPSIIVRMFNTVGPRQSGRYGMVIPRFVHQALTSQPLTVYGMGTQRRCFCHVHDAVEALVTLMDREDAYGEVFNVGTRHETTIAGLAQRVIEFAESDSQMTYIPYDEAYEQGFEDMHRRIPDTSKLQAFTGWRPTHSLDTIIDDVISQQRGATVAIPDLRAVETAELV